MARHFGRMLRSALLHLERPNLAPPATTTLGSRASDRATMQYDGSEEPL
jgi:hypothetical protein